MVGSQASAPAYWTMPDGINGGVLIF